MIQKNKKKEKNGFTLVETLAVIVILSIIALIAVPALTDVLGTTNDTYYDSLKKMVELEAKDYFADNRVLLPLSTGDKNRVSLDTLVRLNYIEQPVSTKNNPCDGYVEVTKNNGYKYLTCLRCDDYISDDSCDFSANGNNNNNEGAGSRAEGYLVVSPTHFEIDRYQPFVAPYAKYYYNGELVRDDIGATPSYIDTSVFTTYTLTYYYLNATPVTVQVDILDVIPPSEVTVNLKKDSLQGATYSYDDGWTTSDVYQIFSAQDDDGGSDIKGYEYSFVNQPNNNSVWTLITDNYITQKDLLSKQESNLKDIDTEVFVRAVDNFNNKGPVTSYKIRVDQTPPTYELTLVGETYSNGYKDSVTFNLTCNDSTGGSGAVEPTRSVTENTRGTHTFSGTCADNAGNSVTYSSSAYVYQYGPGATCGTYQCNPVNYNCVAKCTYAVHPPDRPEMWECTQWSTTEFYCDQYWNTCTNSCYY